MGIADEGFLAREIDNWAIVHEKRHARWFALTRTVNMLGHRLWGELPVISNEPKSKFAARLLYLRGLTSFQSTVILTARGLTVDAGTVVRSAFEDLFFLAAGRNDPEFVEAMIAADTLARKKMARAILKIPPDLGLLEVGKEKLRRYLDNTPDDGKKIDFSEVARKGDLSEVYDIYYRSLSHDSAHPTMESLNRLYRLSADGRVESFLYGPDAPDVKTAISYACVIGFYLVTIMSEIFEVKEI